MGLKLKSYKTAGGGNKSATEPLEAGVYPARVVQVIDLGLQKQNPYQGQEKPPAYIVRLTYELCEEFMVDENGEPDESKPRWISEEFPLNPPTVDLAKSTKRAKAIDPNNEFDYDLTQFIGLPCMVTVVNKTSKDGDKVYNNVGGVGTMRTTQANKLDDLKNPPAVFVLDDPDMETFNKFPDWLKDKIKSNLEYKGSELQAALEGKPKVKSAKPARKEEPVEIDDEDQGDAW